jgi:hypothetical protein
MGTGKNYQDLIQEICTDLGISPHNTAEIILRPTEAVVTVYARDKYDNYYLDPETGEPRKHQVRLPRPS